MISFGNLVSEAKLTAVPDLRDYEEQKLADRLETYNLQLQYLGRELPTVLVIELQRIILEADNRMLDLIATIVKIQRENSLVLTQDRKLELLNGLAEIGGIPLETLLNSYAEYNAFEAF